MPRIIAGAAGSLHLRTPRSGTRPTSDRVREGIFSALEARGVLDGARVLDLYAGSGALGLEAVSRGAASAVLVERSGGALAVLRQNVRVVTDALPSGSRPAVTVVGRPVHAYLTSLPVGDAGAPTLVFLDPPYDLPDSEIADELRLLATRAADDATVVLERSARSPAPRLPPGIALVRSRDYGETRVHLLTVHLLTVVRSAVGARVTDGPTVDARAVIAELRAAGCVFAEDEAAILIEAAGGGTARGVAAGDGAVLAGTVLDGAVLDGTPAEAVLDELVRRRVRGEPLEAIVGWADFAGVRVMVEPGVFVPRQRSALLVDLSARLAPQQATVLDLCCGTGGIGAAVAVRRPDLSVLGADLDPAAVRCARSNLPAERVFEGDLFDALPAKLRGSLGLVVVNAPYVPTEAIALMPPEARDHEHRIALDGGDDGLDLHRRIAADAGAWLTPDGVLLIEASERQAPVSAGLFRGHGFAAEVVRDDEIDATAIVVRRGHVAH